MGIAFEFVSSSVCGLTFGTVLGLNDAVAARKLVRLLLADPLGSQEGWEDVLDATDGDLTQGLLIR